MFEVMTRILENFNHLGFFAVYFTSALVLAFTIVYVWNRILWFVERKGRQDKIQ